MTVGAVDVGHGVRVTRGDYEITFWFLVNAVNVKVVKRVFF